MPCQIKMKTTTSLKHVQKKNTPLKFNMEPQNEGRFGRWFSFSNQVILRFHVSFPGCNQKKTINSNQSPHSYPHVACQCVFFRSRMFFWKNPKASWHKHGPRHAHPPRVSHLRRTTAKGTPGPHRHVVEA